MPVVSENTEMLLTCAPEVLDPVLISFGFRRAQRSLVYARDFPEAKQELSLTYDSSPRYGLGAKIHLHPTFQIRMPEIAVEALQMTEDPCRFGTGDVIIGWPVDFLAPGASISAGLFLMPLPVGLPWKISPRFSINGSNHSCGITPVPMNCFDSMRPETSGWFSRRTFLFSSLPATGGLDRATKPLRCLPGIWASRA